MHKVLACLLDGGMLEEFQPDAAGEMLCGHARIEGYPVAILANQRGLVKSQTGEPPRTGGIIYTGSAEKAAYFIENASRERLPILFIQDVSGFMVGPEAEHSGIIRAGAQFVEAMATAVVPKMVLTVNHASGAGYYAMAGQGFDPDFILSWPSGRMAVMEGESAVGAVHGPDIDRSRKAKTDLPPEVKASVESMREDYEHQLDARFAAARGFADAIITPEETRDQLAFLLRVTANYAGPHLGAFVLPEGVGR
jgi:acetyl-CoA carboxylase carboxyltransferase component